MRGFLVLFAITVISALPIALAYQGWVVSGWAVIIRFFLYLLGLAIVVIAEMGRAHSLRRERVLFLISILSLAFISCLVYFVFIGHNFPSKFYMAAYFLMSGPFSLLSAWHMVLIYRRPRINKLILVCGWIIFIAVSVPAFIVMLVPPLPVII
jgi:hypothetical protein